MELEVHLESITDVADLPDPPTESPGLLDRSQWIELSVEQIGPLYVCTYDEESRTAAVFDLKNKHWELIFPMSPEFAEELPLHLLNNFFEALDDVTTH